jgi:PKD repeat protein
MNSTRARSRFGVFTFLILLMAFVAGTGGRFDASASAGSFNAGFETETARWTFVGPDAATVVNGSEGPAQFAAYTGTPDGNITVTPKMGGSMARLGTPKDISSSQPSGINSASQTFSTASGTVSFAARLFSWEPRANTDYVSFDFTQAGTHVGTFQPVAFKKKDGTTAASCAGGNMKCSSAINVGKSGDYLSSLGSSPTGWVIITVGNLPINQDITFTASVGSTANNSRASWLYLDSANTPPVADFDFNYSRVSLGGGVPGTINASTGTGPLEGAPIQFKDKSSDPDPGDKIVAWEWTATGLNGPLTVQNPFFVPNNDGAYSVTLTVTDSFGAKSAPVTHTITVLNAPPLANALNVEALAGESFPVTGRFTDAGWDDTHTATWANLAVDPPVSGPANPPVTGSPLQEDHAPALGTGKATGTATIGIAGTPATATGRLTISDGNAASDTYDDFKVNALAGMSSLLGHTEFEGTSGARAVTVDGSYLGVIPQGQSRTVYEIKWPGTSGADAQDLPGGSEVLVNLKDLPADYDLILVTVPPAGASSAGYAFSGYAFSDLPGLVSPYSAGYAFSGTGTTGYAFSGPQRAGYGEAGYAFSDATAAGYAFSGDAIAGYAFSGYAFSGYAFSGYAFSGYAFSGDAFAPYAVAGYAFSPISQMGFTGLQTSNTSPSDVSLSELGLGAIPQGTSVVGYSANRGKDAETVLARIGQKGTKLYAIVVGANGAFSPKPFRLDVEGSMTITSAALNAGTDALGNTYTAPGKAILSGPICKARFTGLDAIPTFTGPSLVSAATSPANPTTLFVTQENRLQGLHPAEAASWGTVVSSMQTLASPTGGGVNGKIISVDSAAYGVTPPNYAAWDTAPCSIDAANAVSSAVRARVQAELAHNPTIQYVVILGDDDVIPFQRVPDQVSIGNERSYLSSSFLKQGTPLYASVAGGYNLTDDCNVDAVMTPWQGRVLCLPDKVVSRMVETPLEIAGQANAFIASGGQLNQASAQTARSATNLVSGYDFFADGSTAVADALAQFMGPVTRLIGATWTAADLRCNLLGLGCSTTPPAIADANAHYTHYAALSAKGFADGNAPPPAPPAVPPPGFNDILTSTDIATAGKASISSSGTLIGKLVYTIGCHAGFSAPDRAIADLDPNLGINAKLDFAQAYAQSRAVYIASTGFGIGDDAGIAGTERLLVLYAQQLAVGKSAGQALVDAKRIYFASLSAASVYDEKSSINLTFYGLPMYSLNAAAQVAAEEAVPATTALPTGFVFDALNIVPKGKYYSIGGDAAAPPYRPLQPRQVIEVDPNPAPLHGVLWTYGHFTDTTGFNPVITRPSVEWENNPPEPQVCYNGFWPSDIFRVNTNDGSGGAKQTVVITPGQFRCDSTSGNVTGTQRLFDTLYSEMLRSTSTDMTPPSLTNLDIDQDANGGGVLNITASDPLVGGAPTTGVARIVVLRISPSTGLVTNIADTLQTITPVPDGLSHTFPVTIPNPGNDRLIIQVVDGAGNVGIYSAKGPGLRILNVNLGPDQEFKDSPVSFNAFTQGLPVPAMVGPVSYFWDFGDGSTETTATNTNTHTFSATQLEYTVKVRVTDANGGVGVDRMKVRYYCSDPANDVPVPPDPAVTLGQADFVGCRVSLDTSGKMTITLKTVAPLTTATSAYPAKIRYTITTVVGSALPKSFSYREGNATGIKSLTVVLSGNTISFTFDPKDIGWSAGKTLYWYADTQAGIPGTTAAGQLDRMKDVGTFSYP